MELRTGMRWQFRVTDLDSNKVTEKTQTVFAEEAVPGKSGVRANRLLTTKPKGEVTSWQEDTGTAVIRHREHDQSGTEHTEELYEPFRTRIDESAERTLVGATWSESYTERITDQAGLETTTPKVETWTVAAVDEVVETPSGAYCALRVTRSSTAAGNAGSTKTFWFVRGIGKVKEQAKDQVEELVEFEDAP